MDLSELYTKKGGFKGLKTLGTKSAISISVCGESIKRIFLDLL